MGPALQIQLMGSRGMGPWDHAAMGTGKCEREGREGRRKRRGRACAGVV